MSVFLVDLANDRHDLQINWWNWRPILAFLRGADLIDDDQFERMSANGCGGRVNASEARMAAAFMKEQVLPRLKEGGRMHVDGRVSKAPLTSRLISSLSVDELYAAHKSCIEAFASFCEASAGFEVC